MPLFNLPQQSKQPDTFDVDCAVRLSNILRNARRLTTKINKTAWANEFRLLRKANYTEGQIRNVLNWLSEHIKDQYTPVACSAKSFRSKFPAFLEAINRQLPEAPTTISPEAQAIYKKLALVWPDKESEDGSAAFIQANLDAVAAFRKKLFECGRTWEDAHKPLAASNSCFVVLALVGSPENFTEWWVVEVCGIARRWSEWNGKLMRWVFRPDHKIFAKKAKQCVVEYCGDSTMYDKILEAINDR